MKLGSALSQAPRGVTGPSGLEKRWSEVCGHRQSWGGGVQCGGKARPACEPNTHGPHGGDGSRGGSWCGWPQPEEAVISREAWVRGSPGFGGHFGSSSGSFAPVSSPAGAGTLPTPKGRPEGQTSHCVRKTHRGPAKTMHLQRTEKGVFAGGVLNRIPVSRTTREAELRVNYYPAIEKYEIVPFAATWTD